jgi:Fe-S cluster assembly protein SufD
MGIVTTSRRPDVGGLQEIGGAAMNANAAAVGSRVEAELAAQFADLRARRRDVESVAAWRAENFERFARIGIPGRRYEPWHFTDLRAALRVALAPAAGNASAALAAAPASLCPDAIRLAIVDGCFHAGLSNVADLPAGVRVRSLTEVLGGDQDEAGLVEGIFAPGATEDPLVALNAAMMTGGICLEIGANVRVDRPVELIEFASGRQESAIFSRSFVRLGAGSRLSLVQTGGGAQARRQINSVFVAALADNAVLDMVWAGPSPSAAIQIESVLLTLGAGSKVTSSALICDAAFLRRQTFVRFDGPGAEASFAGLSLLRGAERADNTLVLSHVAPQCRSRELFKHVVDDEAVGVFQGKIVVAPGAQKTDASMASRTVLVSDRAGMDNKPELEIFADDVICGHGATCGDLDEDLLFYVMSRGLPREEAEALLLEAFAVEAMDQIADEALRGALLERARRWLDRRGS